MENMEIVAPVELAPEVGVVNPCACDEHGPCQPCYDADAACGDPYGHDDGAWEFWE